MLRKDFLVHPAQVIESRAAGGDAVLLIAAALSELELKGMSAVAADLGLGALVETHSEEDLAKALATDAPVIGVNARGPGDARRRPRARARDAARGAVGPRRGARERGLDPRTSSGRSTPALGRARRRDADAVPRPRGHDPIVAGCGVNALDTLPDERGRFGAYGGDTCRGADPALDELAAAWSSPGRPGLPRRARRAAPDFVGRPSAMTFAPRLSEATGYRIYLKREDLNHTGAHKINNTLGQVLLARRLGKGRIIAETGAGMHGVATATACALFGLPCVVYMGEEDTIRQAPNVARMQLLGAEVVTVTSGSRTLKDALNEALRDWAASVVDTHYVLGSVAGPHPFPALVRDLQRVIGDEARVQVREREGRDPDVVVACVGGGSNAIGIFEAFLPETERRARRRRGRRPGRRLEHCRSLTLGPGVLHGSYSYLLQDEQGQVVPTHSISAGLDYPGGPRARVPEGRGPRHLRLGHRRRGARGLPRAGDARGDPARARAGPCDRLAPAASASRRARSYWSTCRVEATRTSRPCGHVGLGPGAARA